MDCSQQNIKMDHADQIAHLQMIQSIIERMSTASAVYKGFAATIISGVSVLSHKDISSSALLFALTPVLCFFLLDTYYFQLEKKYRVLYEKVRCGAIAPNFSMKAECSNTELYDAGGTWWQCVISPCILWFYVPLSGIGIVIVLLNYSKIL